MTSPLPWLPDDDLLRTANVAVLMRERGCRSYEALHARSVQHREEFWHVMIEKLDIRFSRSPRSIMDLSRGVEHVAWLPGAAMNITDSCFTANLDKIAVYEADERTTGIRTLSYRELFRLTCRVANGIRQAGYAAGDPIAINLPMTSEAVACYLGIIRAGRAR